MQQIKMFACPEYSDPVLPVLLSFCSHLCAGSKFGFFSPNDVKILIDVSIRELTNILPGDGVEEKLRSSTVRSGYIFLLSVLARHTAWMMDLQGYGANEVAEIIMRVQEEGDSLGMYDECSRLIEYLYQ